MKSVKSADKTLIAYEKTGECFSLKLIQGDNPEQLTPAPSCHWTDRQFAYFISCCQQELHLKQTG